MLPDRYQQMLTAYVDGELAPRQQELVQQMLRKSPEARQLLEKLLADSKDLQELPRRKANPELADQVMGAIVERGLQPMAPLLTRRTITRHAGGGWKRWAMAAAVLLVACTGLFLAFPKRTPVAVPIANKSSDPRDTDKLMKDLIQDSFSQFGWPMDPGVRVAFNDLSREKTRKELKNVLDSELAFHLDLPVRNQARAVEDLSLVFKKHGVQLIVDSRARNNLKKPDQSSGQVLVYAEGIKPEELAKILEDLGGQGKVKAEIPFQEVRLSTLLPYHRLQVSKMLGVSPEKLQPAKKGPADPPDKLFQTTIIDASKTKNNPSTAKEAPPTNQERIAVILPMNTTNGTQSPEVQDFLNQRRDLRPGTLQVVFILHEGSA